MVTLTFAQYMDLEARLHQAAGVVGLCSESLGSRVVSTDEDVENALWTVSHLLEEAKEILADSDHKYTEENTDEESDEEGEESSEQNWWDLAFSPVGSATESVDLALQNGDGAADGDEISSEADEGDEENSEDDDARITATFVVLIDKE